MGLANSSLEKHKEAVDNFKKALELEPDNESYRSNLQIAEDKVGALIMQGCLLLIRIIKSESGSQIYNTKKTSIQCVPVFKYA